MFRRFYSPLVAKLFSTICSIVVGIGTLKLSEVYLSVPEFGVLAVALQVLAYLPLLDGGVRTAANYRILSSDSEGQRGKLFAFCQKFYSWFGVAVLVATSLAMVLYFSSSKVRSSGYPLSFFLAVGTSSALAALVMAQGAMLIALHCQHTVYWLQGMGSLLTFSVLVVGLANGLKLWSFPLANVLTIACLWPMFIGQLRRKVPGFRVLDFAIGSDFKEELKNLWRESFDSFRTQLSILLLFSLDLVIVGMLFGFKVAAPYALFMRVLTILRSLMQSAGEVSWPLWAQVKGAANDWSYLLLKGNAWFYGSVGGALSFALIPFLQWFMGPEWTGDPTLLAFMLARFVITGISNPAGYYLIGQGKFRTLAKLLERELAACLIFAFFLRSDGAEGVALAFLLGTIFGTGLPILLRYAAILQLPPFRIVGGLWLRATIGFAASIAVTALFTKMWSKDLAILSGAAGACAGLFVATLFASLHFLRKSDSAGAGFKLKSILYKI